ncbi:hypothetical protein [uncultured Shewanella sp.]|uniref:hypothetical protein n=1 Tax=uncultured Shewanella sp. TaxID=173975 RepID=UPI0026370A23|nr:hypothetical protein [uncultured Shewanella sp.]
MSLSISISNQSSIFSQSLTMENLQTIAAAKHTGNVLNMSLFEKFLDWAFSGSVKQETAELLYDIFHNENQDETQIKNIIEKLNSLAHSQDPLKQCFKANVYNGPNGEMKCHIQVLNQSCDQTIFKRTISVNLQEKAQQQIAEQLNHNLLALQNNGLIEKAYINPDDILPKLIPENSHKPLDINQLEINVNLNQNNHRIAKEVFEKNTELRELNAQNNLKKIDEIKDWFIDDDMHSAKRLLECTDEINLSNSIVAPVSMCNKMINMLNSVKPEYREQFNATLEKNEVGQYQLKLNIIRDDKIFIQHTQPVEDYSKFQQIDKDDLDVPYGFSDEFKIEASQHQLKVLEYPNEGIEQFSSVIDPYTVNLGQYSREPKDIQEAHDDTEIQIELAKFEMILQDKFKKDKQSIEELSKTNNPTVTSLLNNYITMQKEIFSNLRLAKGIDVFHGVEEHMKFGGKGQMDDNGNIHYFNHV